MTAIEPAQPNTALLSLILMISTFLIAFKLKHFRNSKFLGRSVSAFVLPSIVWLTV